MFEPLWNRNFVDHIQFSVSEAVGVEGRGGYYDRSGVLRDMMQNHMFQMLAYLCMEPPSSFAPEAVRNEKAKVLEAVRIMDAGGVRANTVRGQYGPGRDFGREAGARLPGGAERPAASRQPRRTRRSSCSSTTGDGMGVPIYLRSGKRLWKRGTEIIVQLKNAPDVVFRGTAMESLDPNRLIFHIQPDQGIELRFQAKTPGPEMSLQKVNMRFDYSQAFTASRAVGYEVLIYNCMNGDATLFSRTDLVETAWRIAQPILDAWKSEIRPIFPIMRRGAGVPRPRSN